MRILLSAVFLFWALGLQAGGLSPQEQTLVDAVAEREPAARTLLERIVNINSGTGNHAGVKAVADELAPAFEALGFSVAWVDGKAFQRAGHLLARFGDRGPKLLLIGHLDTVFAPDSQFQRYQVIDERYVKGPGITDMKGGNIVMLMALQGLKDAGLLDQLQIQVVLTGDEEDRGEPLLFAIEPLRKAGRWADIALGFEDGDGDPTTAVVARRSSANWRLEIAGKPAHSSQIFREDIGHGAVYEMARVLEGFRAALKDEQLLTFNPGVVVAGTDVALCDDSRGTAFGKLNVIARKAVVEGDLRALTPEQQARAWGIMEGVAKQSLPHTRTRFTHTDRYPAMAPTDGNHALLAVYSQASQDLGYGPVRAVDPRRAGAADISFVAGSVAQALDGLGLMGTGGHTDEEVADMHTLKSQASRAALLMHRLAQP
ncbi:M20/M25/M40 family metallo-hydrolase [Simiduia sp. 21SJ11W-1]|uniref:M20/M25/M40 family metallo-hydrolase n=1 Tax=Simiduia sp. 21SJ11W-1 TaxID=2909669 RepID=UPI00209E9320|nr:M20/M25/M40 family metallo-hydrolase [Simiduia sp. 21SJ11W-1]UTA49057.1 M20/M25/M40 family metallo-hydrolase [Simiduia sp. 21SJ11W-1]